MKSDFDIIIVGGGIIGATLACSLAMLKCSKNSEIKIALIESNSIEFKSYDSQDFDLRVSAITRASQHVFSKIGIWPSIETKRHSVFSEMRVWDDTGNGDMHFSSADVGEPYLGHIIENSVVLSSLYQRIDELKNLTLISPDKIIDISYLPQLVKVDLLNSNSITAGLIVAADGSESWLRHNAGIVVRGWDYPQDALVTWVKTEKPHQFTAWQRFMPDGPLAFLPLDTNICSIVWSSTPDHIKQLLSFSDTDFRSALGNAFSNTLGAIIESGARARFPLRFFVAENYIKPRLVLIGDAAHTVHPLAGQGVNIGISDIVALTSILQSAFNNNLDLGLRSVLRQYERSRRAENLPMLSAVNGIHELFGSDHAAIIWARNAGMNITQKLPLLKNIIMRHAMGLSH